MADSGVDGRRTPKRWAGLAQMGLVVVVLLLSLPIINSEVTPNLVPMVASLVFGLMAASVAILFFAPAVPPVGDRAVGSAGRV